MQVNEWTSSSVLEDKNKILSSMAILHVTRVLQVWQDRNR